MSEPKFKVGDRVVVGENPIFCQTGEGEVTMVISSSDRMVWYQVNGCYVVREDYLTPAGHAEQSFTGAAALTEQVAGDHYKQHKIQPVEYIHGNGLGFVEGCVVKYVSRHKAKGGADDIRKAIHFLRILLSLEYGVSE